MAFDQRFAMVLVGSSGKGGATLLRRNFGEAVESLAGGGYYWMAGNFMKYGVAKAAFGNMNPGDLPVDSDELIALCAPRLTFISYGIPERGDAKWLDHRGSFMATVAASPVWTLLGAKGLGVEEEYRTAKMPAVNDGLLEWTAGMEAGRRRPYRCAQYEVFHSLGERVYRRPVCGAPLVAEGEGQLPRRTGALVYREG